MSIFTHSVLFRFLSHGIYLFCTVVVDVRYEVIRTSYLGRECSSSCIWTLNPALNLFKILQYNFAIYF